MDQDPEVIETFEDILKKNINRSRVLLYKNSKSISTSNYKPKDVIVDVSSQLKAIKKADKVIRNKNTLVNVCKHNSNFLPVHNLPVFEGQPSTSNKFETQCELDTQLLDLIRNAEECDGPGGMTQEFETTFTHAHDLDKECSTPVIKMTQQIKHFSDTNTVKNLSTICVSIEAKDTSNVSDVVDNALVSFSNDRNKVEIEVQAVVDTDTVIGQDKDNQRECFKNSQNEHDRHVEKFHDIDKEIEVNIGTCSLDILSQFEDNTAPIDKKYMNKDTDCSQRCVSPILNLKTIKQHKRPLVYDLETFEKFESIATPLVAQHTDMKTAKHLINSQILGTELTTCGNAELNADEQPSQIIELKAKQTIPSKGGINKVDFPIAENEADAVKALSKHTAQSVKNPFHVKQPKIDPISIVNRTDITKAQSIDNYDDEILFSSDEEDYKPAEYEDMPFTCALETSFYDMSQVLDKTMFVAFQTASNKSIQVQTDSFHKAKTILDDFDHKGLSITELVKISDMAKESQVTINNLDHLFKVDEANDEHPDRDCIIEETGDGIRIESFNKLKANMENRTELPSFQGFTTASNKIIKLSEQALSRCREVFQDIDIAVDHDSIKLGEAVKTINTENTKTLVASNMQSDVDSKPTEDASKHTNVENEYFINESINDDLLIKEFENIEMSLGESCVNTNSQVVKCGINVSKSDGIEAGNDENNRLEHLRQFQGFKTANNKHIHISKNALAETKRIFQDIDCLDILSGNNVKEKQSCSVPETEFNKPSTSRSNIFDSFKTVDVNNVLDKSADQLFVGFKTAANKSIAISKEAVDKSRRIFEDIQNCPEKEFDPLPTCTETTKENLNHGRSFIKTDIKRHTDIKTQSVDFQRFPEHVSAKTKILVNNNDINENVTCGAENKNHNPISATYGGFTTANDKPVTVSKDAFAKSKQLFQDFNVSLEANADSFDKDRLKFQGNTASIKTEKTSELVVNGIVEQKQFNSVVEAKETVLQPNLSAKAFEGFTTASNKPVQISKEALLKSKKLFEDIDIGVPNDNELLPPSNKAQIATATFRGFSTASHKPVQVSEEALLKSKKLFDDVSQCNESSVFVGNKARINSTDRFVGFATASNKVVKVSKEALAKSKQMFDDIHSVNQDFTNVGDKPKANKAPYNIEAKVNALDNTIKAMGKLEGFQTGNNRKVPDLFKYPKLKDIDDVKDDEYSPVKADMDIMDTQVLKDFDATLYTEDFQKTPRRNKRSGSPILSCPRAKKRRFETPHRITKMATPVKIDDAVKITVANADYLDVNYKKNKKYTLKDLLNLERDNSVKKTLPENLAVGFDDLLSITISGERNDLSETALTMQDIKEVFLKSVNRNLIPANWLDNHLKLILWKLLSYEIKFPSSLRLACSAKNVLRQLKYRYDTELYGAKRSVLRLILEKDDIPARTMVLCVVTVLIDGVKVDRPNKPENVELLVTDGWYCLKCTLDSMLAQLACAGRLKVGDKVITSSAELVGCRGLAPWEDTSEVRLKIFGNSTRKARWDLRLGSPGIPQLRVSLAGARPAAGPLALRLGLLRVYPALYVRRTTHAGTVTRSERLEHLYQIEYEAERQALMEKIYEEVEKRFNEQESQASDCSALSCASGRGLSSGSQLARALRRSRDPAEFMQSLSASQAGLLQHYTCQRRDRLLREVGGEAGGEAGEVGGRVARVLKVRVVDGRGGGRTRGMMSVWSPTEAVREMLAEGGWLDVRDVVPTGYRNSEIQISAGRQSIFRPANITRTDERYMFLNSLSRVCYSIKDLMRNPCTENNEVDTYGMVFLIDPAMDKFDSKHHLFQNVYMTDLEKNLLCVNFWGGLKKFGYQNIIDTGQIVACANLQKRIGNTRKSIPQYRATEFSQFTTSPKNDATRNLTRDLEAKFKNVDKNKFFDDCTVLKNNLCTNRYVNNENISPYRLNNSVDLKNKAFIEVPAGNRKDEFNLTGLDFESTFKQSEEQLSPKTLHRKSKVKERIAKLKMYGDPPPLSPMHIMSKSKRAHNSYKSPLISKSDVCSSVASAKKGNDSCNEDDRQTIKSSPIISMNKTCVKRCHINPTKLNFSHNSKDNESLDEI